MIKIEPPTAAIPSALGRGGLQRHLRLGKPQQKERHSRSEIRGRHRAARALAATRMC